MLDTSSPSAHRRKPVSFLSIGFFFSLSFRADTSAFNTAGKEAGTLSMPNSSGTWMSFKIRHRVKYTEVTMKENRVEEVVKTHAEGFSCAQALLAVYGPELGMDRQTALKVAGGFGGGMGRMAGICGAVTGAFMIIGLVHSMTKKGDMQQKELSYEYIRKFAETFRERNRTLVCRELMGVDVSTPEGFAEAKVKNIARTICPKYVRDAAEILEELLADTLDK
jgi:C_GCAxxG_C_C family probable redox protein